MIGYGHVTSLLTAVVPAFRSSPQAATGLDGGEYLRIINSSATSSASSTDETPPLPAVFNAALASLQREAGVPLVVRAGRGLGSRRRGRCLRVRRAKCCDC